MKMHTFALFAATCLTAFAAPSGAQDVPATAEEINRRIGVGINVGSSMDSPDYYNRDDIPSTLWSGGKITEDDIDRIKQAGFQSVRIPVRWYPYAEVDGNGTQIPDYWFDEVEQVIDWVLERDMVAILNQHHENPLFDNPTQENLDRFVGFWRQIADRYQDKPENLVFELLNEPHGKITPEQLNDIYARAFADIRNTNPTRVVVFGGRGYNGWYHLLNELKLPDDPYIIGTFHRYAPNPFTHQGVRKDPVGPRFDDVINGKKVEAWALDGFDEVQAWSRRTGIPVLLGEFGVSVFTPHEDALKYQRLVIDEARRRGFSATIWSYHDVHFGLWDRRVSDGWDNEALQTILPDPESEK